MDPHPDTSILDSPITYLYSFCSSILLVYAGWGLCLWNWEEKGINANYLLEFEAKNCLTGRDILTRAFLFGSIFNANFILYCKMRRGAAGALGLSAGCWVVPLLLLCMTFVMILLPLKRRMDLFRGIWETIKTPFGRVSFRENIIGDFATSFVKVFTGR